MNTKILLLLPALLLVGCGNDYSDPRVERISEKAPSLTKSYSEDELIEMMDNICEGVDPDIQVNDRDEGYLYGMALATCE